MNMDNSVSTVGAAPLWGRSSRRPSDDPGRERRTPVSPLGAARAWFATAGPLHGSHRRQWRRRSFRLFRRRHREKPGPGTVSAGAGAGEFPAFRGGQSRLRTQLAGSRSAESISTVMAILLQEASLRNGMATLRPNGIRPLWGTIKFNQLFSPSFYVLYLI